MTATDVQQKLALALKSNGKPYWNTLKDFIQGSISRCEFEEIIRQYITTPHLVYLHNSMLMHMLYSASLLTPPTPPPSLPKSRGKRRRLLPYQGPGSPESSALRSARLNKWTVSMGKKERDRIRGIGTQTPQHGLPPANDEIMADKGVKLFNEGKNVSGTLMPLALCSFTRSLPSAQLLGERLYLIASQHDLSFQHHSSRSVIALLNLALEAHLKAILTNALSLTANSHRNKFIRSTIIAPSANFQRAAKPPSLSLATFQTLFTLSPSLLPIPSAAVNRLSWTEATEVDEVNVIKPEGSVDGMKENNELLPVGELWGLLKGRSGIRELVDQAGIRFS